MDGAVALPVPRVDGTIPISCRGSAWHARASGAKRGQIVRFARREAQETNATFVSLSSQDAFDRLLAASAEEPVILFKHDDACSISMYAYRELAAVPGDVFLIDVERDHDLSQSLATQLGVEHESPQVIVVCDGQPVYTAALWQISRDEVTHAADRDIAGPGE